MNKPILITKINNKLINTYHICKVKSVIKRKNLLPNNSILIFSDPRGGSTWLAEILLNSIPKSYILWEPLALRYVKEVNKLNFGWRQHIPKNVKWDQAKVLFDKILSGKIVNRWTAQKTSISEVKRATLQITKICRGNDLLPWLVEQFNFEHKPIYLIRHPFAVVASQLKQGGWDSDFTGFHFPDVPYNQKYIQHKKFLGSLSTKAQSLVATWCLTNIHDFNPNNKWITIFYEDLFINPKEVLLSVFNDWEISLPQEIDAIATKRSSTTVDYNELNSKKIQLNKWQNYFSLEEIDELQSVLDYFGITYYSKKNIFPNKLNLPKH